MRRMLPHRRAADVQEPRGSHLQICPASSSYGDGHAVVQAVHDDRDPQRTAPVVEPAVQETRGQVPWAHVGDVDQREHHRRHGQRDADADPLGQGSLQHPAEQDLLDDGTQHHGEQHPAPHRAGSYLAPPDAEGLLRHPRDHPEQQPRHHHRPGVGEVHPDTDGPPPAFWRDEVETVARPRSQAIRQVDDHHGCQQHRRGLVQGIASPCLSSPDAMTQTASAIATTP
jgi:hypothetical protein